MVGQTNKDEEIRRALKSYILREREKQKLEDEAEAEKTRKKLELDQKKLKEETEYKAVKDKLAEVIKRQEQLKQDRVKVFEHLKKVIQDPVVRQSLSADEIDKIQNLGLVVTLVNTVPSQPVYLTTVPTTAIPRASTVSVNSQYKTSAPPIPVQSLPAQKRSRSPSPFHPAYNYKQVAGPHAFQKPGSSIQSSSYNPFYGAGQNVPYTHPSSSVHSNAPVYSSYNTGREDTLHKAQPTVMPPHTAPQHASIYSSHRSSLPPGPSSSMQSSNHVSYLVDKAGQSYSEDKYGMVRPSSHVVHAGQIPIQQPPPANKHGSISSGYPVRPVATQIVPPSQLHLQQSHGGHHGSQQSHHSTQQPPHHSSIPHHAGPSHQSHQSHHSSAQQSQSHLSQSHHPQSSIHYPPHSQPQLHHSSSQQPHSSPQPPVSVQSHHSNQHHQQHLQQLHVSAHHSAPGPHHQLLSHHQSSIHHTSSQQHMHHPALQHHQQVLQQSHQQQMHHQQMGQPHIQQHISSHQSHQSHQSHMQNQQSQPTSVVTSQVFFDFLTKMCR
ncbi:hypothetical protein V9T40_014576 [Parthenolecanium corni]|uniref:G protein pathway suppressor 2 n=1 Tax=Parthenolecanium corni TaxID=536013 RepID=A0AAN9T7C7_9HEMI